MAKGKQHTKKNKRAFFINNELQHRLAELKSNDLYQQDTKESIAAALKMLQTPVKASPTLIIAFTDCLPASGNYKNAMPKGYVKTLKNLNERLQEIAELEEAAQQIANEPIVAIELPKLDRVIPDIEEIEDEVPEEFEELEAEVPEEIQPKKPKVVAQGNEFAVDKKSEFFIALGKTGIHSFVMLGVMQAGEPKLLARVGKTNSVDKDFGRGCKMTAKALFSHTDSELHNESLRLWNDISYSAYAINYAHYQQFMKLASLAQGSAELECYQTVREDDDTYVMSFDSLAKPELANASEREQAIVQRTKNLHVTNTCRNTAIDLVEYTQGTQLSSNVSHTFFRDLPVKAVFNSGKPDRHFYVFPLPPAAHEADHEKMVILTKIYKRMEQLLQKEPYSQNTIEKFEALKTLYQQQAGVPNGNIEDALVGIKQWKEEHKAVISQLRDQSFFGKLFVSKSSTVAMADDIESSLANGKK